MVVRQFLPLVTVGATTVLSLGLSGCKCSASASLETDSDTMTEQEPRILRDPVPTIPDVIPAEASPLPANIPTFLADFCLVRFEREGKLTTKQGEPAATVDEGEVRVLSEWHGDAYVLDITPYGVHEYKVMEDERGVPFEANCSQDETVPYSAVFVDSTVYRSDRFEDELCHLEHGTTVRERGPQGYEIAERVFQFKLGGLADKCKEADEGFIRLEDVSATDERTLLPVHRVLAPK